MIKTTREQTKIINEKVNMILLSMIAIVVLGFLYTFSIALETINNGVNLDLARENLELKDNISYLESNVETLENQLLNMSEVNEPTGLHNCLYFDINKNSFLPSSCYVVSADGVILK